jgi:hypothetical protein
MNRSSLRSTLTGAALGLTWGAGFRGWMIVIAGNVSSFTWSGTFAGIRYRRRWSVPYSAGQSTHDRLAAHRSDAGWHSRRCCLLLRPP